jgi:hypothetical protein
MILSNKIDVPHTIVLFEELIEEGISVKEVDSLIEKEKARLHYWFSSQTIIEVERDDIVANTLGGPYEIIRGRKFTTVTTNIELGLPQQDYLYRLPHPSSLIIKKEAWPKIIILPLCQFTGNRYENSWSQMVVAMFCSNPPFLAKDISEREKMRERMIEETTRPKINFIL